MALNHSPSVVSNGLTLYHDFVNRKSYTGPAIQNKLTQITPTGQGTATGYYSFSGTELIDIPQIGPTSVAFNSIQNNYTSYNPNSTNCCPSLFGYGAGIPVSGSTLYTYAIVYKCDSGYTGANYMYRYEYNGGTYVTEAGVHSDSNRIHLGNNWYWAWGTFTTQPSTTVLNYTGLWYYQYSTISDKVYVAKALITPGDQTGLHPKYWPELNTTKTTAQSLKDLTNNRTTSTLNVTYPSGKNSVTYPYLNSYSSAVATDSSSILDTDTHSIFFWIRFNTTTTYGSNGYSGGWDKIFSFNAPGSDRSPSIWRYPSNRLIHWRYDPGNTGTDISLNGTLSSNWGTDFIIDTWYYVGVTKNNGTATAYYNGVNVGTNTVAYPKTSGSAALLYFESYPTDLCSLGLCKIYNRVLTDEEVQQNFNALRGRYGI